MKIPRTFAVFARCLLAAAVCQAQAYPSKPIRMIAPFAQADLTGIVLAGTVPFVMVSSLTVPFKTVPELLQYARANPGKVTYASGGSGTIGNLGAHWFSEMAGMQLQHIPYKGGSQAMTDLIGGQVQIFFDTLVTSTPFIKCGPPSKPASPI